MSHGRHHDPIQALNDEHADELLAVGRALARHPDATSVRAERVDGTGIDLTLDTPQGPAQARVWFSAPVADTDRRGLRAAFADLATQARDALTGGGSDRAADERRSD